MSAREPALPPSLVGTRAPDVAFWSGTGISADAPAQCPVGDVLTRRVLDQAFSPALLGRLERAYSALRIDRPLPRLETLLDVAAEEHGLEILPAILADVAVARPNDTHRFFADHTRSGGRHITANFDLCIERAGAVSDAVVHFHGRLDREDDGRALGARISLLERGFDDSQRSEIDNALNGVAAVVIVGYSGRDYFDVDPYWRDLSASGRVKDRTILWIAHDVGWESREGDACRDPHLRRFAEGGARVFEFRGPTRAVLNQLAAMWGFAPISPPPANGRVVPPHLELADETRSMATTRFAAFAGIQDSVRESLAAEPDLKPHHHAWLAEAHWSAGRYREAAGEWGLSRPADRPEDRAFRDERHAASLWVRGELRRAYTDLRPALLAARGAKVSATQQLVMAETLGRILVHLSRLPDVRWFASRARRTEALRYLADAEDGCEALGVQMRARVQSVRADLQSEPFPASFSAEVDFEQSEALLPMLNYRHARLRQRSLRGDRPTVHEFRQLAREFAHLGAFGDAARVPLIPAAEPAFSAVEVWKGFRGVDFTLWHRWRLYLGWAVRRISRARRRHHAAQGGSRT